MPTISVDELQYDWPVDVLNYESRFLLGLSHFEALGVALPAVGLMLVHQLPLSFLALIGGFLVVRKWEGLGDRNILFYLFARLQYQVQDHRVTLPLILPTGQVETIIVYDLEGNEIVQMGGQS